MSVVVAVDAGTTGIRAVALDESSQIVAVSYREFTQHFPRPGWVEHDPTEILTVTDVVLSELTGSLSEPVAAIGIGNQRETVVAWDRRSGAPLHNAIVWQDRRTAAACDRLVADGHLSEIRRLTGLVADPYFSASKMHWLLSEGGVTRSPDLALGTIDSWVLWHLTGGADGGTFATDPSNASRTMLYDIGARRWSPQLTDLFDVPPGALAEVHDSCGRFGVTTAACPLGAAIPVSGIAGDQQAALFGHACFNPGMTKNTYGTGSFALMNVGSELPDPVDGLLTTVAWTLPERAVAGTGHPSVAYALEGSIFVTGAAVQWLRDGLGIIDASADVGPLAESVPDSGGVVLVPAFTGLGSPWWDPWARGALMGLTRGSNRAHIARATVESMALQTRDVIDAMTEASGQTVSELRVDGGASAMPLLLQVQADQLNVDVVRPVVTETTALGAAYLAGLAEGVWATTTEVSRSVTTDVRVSPSGDRDAAEQLHEQWLRAVPRALRWLAGD